MPPNVQWILSESHQSPVMIPTRSSLSFSAIGSMFVGAFPLVTEAYWAWIFLAGDDVGAFILVGILVIIGRVGLFSAISLRMTEHFLKLAVWLPSQLEHLDSFRFSCCTRLACEVLHIWRILGWIRSCSWSRQHVGSCSIEPAYSTCTSRFSLP